MDLLDAVLIYFFGLAISVMVLYTIIKNAVKNGVKEALEERDEEVLQEKNAEN